MEDGRAKIQFDNGDVHRYRPQSLHKLKPIVDDAHAFSPSALFHMVDTDNSGHLSLEEFKTLHEIIVKDERKAASELAELQAESMAQQVELKRTRKVVLGLFIFVFLLLACIGGLMTAVVAAYKDTETTDAFFADMNGNVLQTTPAVVALPLLAAPVLPIKQLHSVTRLTISYEDLEFDEEVQVVENVIGIIAVNNTAVRFQMACANVKEVSVWNGEATAILADDSEVELCEADVECSALMVKDAEAASSLLAEASAALEAAGFNATDAVESSRRRLMGEDSTSECTTVNCANWQKEAEELNALRSINVYLVDESEIARNRRGLQDSDEDEGCPYKEDARLLKAFKKWLKNHDYSYRDAASRAMYPTWFEMSNRNSASYEVAADGSTIQRRQLVDKELVAQYRTVHRPRFGELQKEIYGRSGDETASTVDLVIARYDEDSKWLLDVERELPDVRIFVYEKGSSAKIPSACKTLALKNATCVPLANVGREAHAFLTHLIERHDDLGDKVVFAQAGPPGYGFLPGEQGGHLMPGTDFFYDYLLASSPAKAVFTMAYANIPGRELLLRRDGYLFNEPFDRNALPTDAPSVCSSNWHVVNNGTVHFWDALHAPVPEQDLPNHIEFYNTHMRNELGPLTGEFVPFANGAVLSAAGAKLRSRPKAFYERLRRTTSVGDQPDAIFYIEMLFAYITGHEAAAHECAAQIARHVEAPADKAFVRSAA